MNGVASAEAPPVPREGILPILLRTLVHGICPAVFAFPLTVTEAVAAAGAGGVIGALLGQQTARTAVRLPVVWLASVVLMAVGVTVRGLVVEVDDMVARLGPAAALRYGEALQVGISAAAVSLSLRASAVRRPTLRVMELAYVGVAFTALVIAHRNGAIHRPFDLADPILERGWDPTVALLGVGAAAAVTGGLLLLSERNLGRALFHGAALLLGLLLLLSVTAVGGLPTPPIDDDALGLRGDGESDDEDEHSGRGGGSSRPDDELEFRDDYNSEAQRFPVGVVLFHDDYTPPLGVYYFRQGAFSQYNGRRLVSTTRRGVDVDIAGAFPSGPTRVDPREPEPWARRKIETTVALLADHTRPFGLESALELRPSVNPDRRRFRRVYRVWSAATELDYRSLIGIEMGEVGWTREVWEHYTEAPEDPRYRALAERIVEEVLPPELRQDAYAQALAIRQWLSARGTYSLQSQHAGATDPTADFLFGDLVGYCVHFAHASTFLMRSLGLPSRVATGYAVDESVRQGGSAVLVNGQTSHAWPELFVRGVGWLVVDVTPAQALSGAPAPPDPDLQRLLAELARGERPLPIEGSPPPKIDELATNTLTWLSRGAFGLFGAMLVFLFGVKGWRRLAPHLGRRADRPRLLYRAALDRLADAAVFRDAGESQESFAKRVKEKYPALVDLTDAHLSARYGGSSRRDGNRAFGEFCREFRQAVPFWRRLVGAFVPWTWIQTR